MSNGERNLPPLPPSSPSPRRRYLSEGTNEASRPGTDRSASVGNLTGGNNGPVGGDVESLLRQWGGSSLMTDIDGDDFSLPGRWASLRDNSSDSFRSSFPNAEGGLGPGFGGVFREDSLRDVAGGAASGMYPAASFHYGDSLAGGAPGDTPGHRRVVSAGAGTTTSAAILDQAESEERALDSFSSAIHDAARITNWNLVAALSKSDPAAAKYAGPDGWTALHHACSRRCPHADVIDSLLRAYPEALIQSDGEGRTPLHHACRFKAPRDVVRLLLRAYPDLAKRAAAGRCNTGRSPLYYAIRYDAPNGVVEMLLQANPAAVLDEDRDGVCPLGLVWDKYASGFDAKRTLHALLRPFEGEGWELGGNADREASDASDGSVSRHSSGSATRRPEALVSAEKKVKQAMKRDACKALRAKWNKVNILLRAYFHFPLQEDDSECSEFSLGHNGKEAGEGTSSKSVLEPLPPNEKALPARKRKWRILHAVSAIKCHPMLFLLARALHPEQALELDENDLFAGREMSSPSDLQSLSIDRQIVSCRTALHFAAVSPLSGRESRNVIKILLSLNPEAPMHVDGYGCLPLHLLAQNERKTNWTQDGLRDVYAAYPEASLCRDAIGRTPLHCAASSAGHYTRSSTAPVSPSHGSPVAQPTSLPAPQGSTQVSLPAGDPIRDLASVIQQLVLANNRAASMADSSGRLPLHYIAEHGEEWNYDTDCILQAYPAASRARAGPSVFDRLPLHLAACSTDARPSLLMNLVNANPRAASQVDSSGRLPLHLACESGRATWDHGLDAIYNAYNRAISITEDSPRKWTVLHTAAASPSAGKGLIEKLLELNPNAASLADGEGRHPLHWACMANRQWEGGVQIIFQADPSVALTEDKQGMLPFHIAALRVSAASSSLDLSPDPSKVASQQDELNDGDDECGGDSMDDLGAIEVLFNLLLAQPSVVHT